MNLRKLPAVPFEILRGCDSFDKTVHSKGLIMRVYRSLCLSLVLLALAHTARASDFCADMTALTSQARTNFLVAPAALPNADNCRMVYALAGGKAFHCSWKFPYREGAATAKFKGFNQTLRTCFDGGTEVLLDEGVNHPDSYAQRQHMIEGVAVSVSIKDKGALQETYVFISVQAVDVQ